MLDCIANNPDSTSPESLCEHTSSESLLAELQQLAHQNGYRYDPIRYCFIESLLMRSKNTNQRVSRLLQEKARQVLSVYQVSLMQAKANASVLLLEIEKNSPQIFEQAKAYFDQGEFDRLKQLHQQQRLSNRPQPSLAELIEHALNGSEPHDSANASQIDELLYQQELKALQSIDGESDEASSFNRKPLKSSQRYQHYQQHQQHHSFMDSLTAAKPSNPGPLNPERLVIELLREMNSLSPQYLRDYLVNLETLLWLEKNQIITNKK